MTDTRQTIRDELVQRLLHRLEKDLSDIPNLSDARVRFLPRQALVDIINQPQVMRLLDTFPIQARETDTTLQDVARYISPQPGTCQCQKVGCTGARMILATLLFIGREDLIELTMSPSTNSKTCDRDLPFGNKSFGYKVIPTRPRPDQDDHNESTHSLEWSPRETQIAGAEVKPALFQHLSPPEKELFSYFQWQVMSSYLTPLGLDETGDEQPDAICLPWQDCTRVEKPQEGQLSFVQKIKIFPGNHNLVCRLQDLLKFVPRLADLDAHRSHKT